MSSERLKRLILLFPAAVFLAACGVQSVESMPAADFEKLPMTEKLQSIGFRYDGAKQNFEKPKIVGVRSCGADNLDRPYQKNTRLGAVVDLDLEVYPDRLVLTDRERSQVWSHYIKSVHKIESLTPSDLLYASNFDTLYLGGLRDSAGVTEAQVRNMAGVERLKAVGVVAYIKPREGNVIFIQRYPKSDRIFLNLGSADESLHYGVIVEKSARD